LETQDFSIILPEPRMNAAAKNPSRAAPVALELGRPGFRQKDDQLWRDARGLPRYRQGHSSSRRQQHDEQRRRAPDDE
jgi:hypothetical protein